jgi:hypothetical protein
MADSKQVQSNYQNRQGHFAEYQRHAANTLQDVKSASM